MDTLVNLAGFGCLQKGFYRAGEVIPGMLGCFTLGINIKFRTARGIGATFAADNGGKVKLNHGLLPS
jgi:hypothetical protein